MTLVCAEGRKLNVTVFAISVLFRSNVLVFHRRVVAPIMDSFMTVQTGQLVNRIGTHIALE